MPGLALEAPGALLALLAAPLAFTPLRAVRVGASTAGAGDAAWSATATLQLVFSVLLAAGPGVDVTLVEHRLRIPLRTPLGGLTTGW